MGFREQTLLRVSRQAPTACVLYLATALLSGICEVVAFPDRLTAQVAFFSFSVLFAALVYGVIRRHPERSVETLS